MDLAHFVCPESGAVLVPADGSLIGGGARYEIVRGVPRFVDSKNYAAAFGLQWNMFKKTQFDSHTGTSITENRLEQAFGHPLSQLRGKRVLEAGSGAGRFTEVLLKHGALVYSFDFSNAVEANFDNNMPHENLTLFQADIRRIPFAAEFFDAVLCLGVLQHTPSTRQSLAELTRVLGRGGALVCDHYKYHLGMFTSLYLPYWFAIKQFSSKWQMRITDGLTRMFFPLHWRFRDNKAAQILLRRVSPINFYYGRYDLPREVQFEWSRLDTHDRNTDHFKRHVTKRDFEAMFRELGYVDPTIEPGGTGYVARAVK